MLVVAVAPPGVAEDRPPADEMDVAVTDESGEETAKIRMGFGAWWHGIEFEGQNAVEERKIGDGV
jgi:hypothetical protein